MNIEEEILKTLHTLPVAQQHEVLDFADFIRDKKRGTIELRPFGLCVGELEVPDDFDAPLPDDVLRSFEQ